MDNKLIQQEKNLIARSELNLEDRKIFTISTFRGKSREIIFTETLPTGESVKRKAIIGKTARGYEIGYLTTYHFLVMAALQNLWEEAGKPVNEPVQFSIYKIAQSLKLFTGGRDLKIIKNWLFDLSQIPLTFIDSFFLKDDGFISTEPFTILSRLKIYEPREKDKRKNTREGHGFFKFHYLILKSLLNNHSRPIPLDVIASFKKKKEMSIALYLYLDRKMSFQDSFHKTLTALWDELDFSQKQIRYPADRKGKLQPVIDQLKNKSLLTGIISYISIQKTRDGKDYKLVVKKEPFQKQPDQQQYQISFTKSIQETSKTDQHITYFHTKLNRLNHQPIQTELTFYQNNLSQYSEEQIKHIIHYAIRKAEETNYQMATINAIKQYINPGLQDYNNKQAQTKKDQENQKFRKQYEQQREEYNKYIQSQIDQYKQTLSQEELDNIHQTLKDQFIKTHPWYQKNTKSQDTHIFQNALNYEIQQHFKQYLDLPDFETWQKQSKT